MKEFIYKNDIPKKISTSLSKSDKVSNLVKEKIGTNWHHFGKFSDTSIRYSRPNVIYDDLNKKPITHDIPHFNKIIVQK